MHISWTSAARKLGHRVCVCCQAAAHPPLLREDDLYEATNVLAGAEALSVVLVVVAVMVGPGTTATLADLTPMGPENGEEVWSAVAARGLVAGPPGPPSLAVWPAT